LDLKKIKNFFNKKAKQNLTDEEFYEILSIAGFELKNETLKNRVTIHYLKSLDRANDIEMDIFYLPRELGRDIDSFEYIKNAVIDKINSYIFDSFNI